MTVTVRAHGELGRYLKPLGGDTASVALPAGATVGALLDRLGINRDEVWLVAVNGDVVDDGEDRRLADGDRVDLFAAVAGG